MNDSSYIINSLSIFFILYYILKFNAPKIILFPVWSDNAPTACKVEFNRSAAQLFLSATTTKTLL